MKTRGVLTQGEIAELVTLSRSKQALHILTHYDDLFQAAGLDTESQVEELERKLREKIGFDGYAEVESITHEVADHLMGAALVLGLALARDPVLILEFGGTTE